ncbi:winged helix-turn-helix domain-containing protein [Halobacteriales archaeon Cl-PHB]
MEDVLWYLLASSRGGPTRVRILRAVDERPRNPNQLADALGMDYTTIRHHLDVLVENNVLRATGDGYGAVYLPTDQLDANRDALETVLDAVDVEDDR